MDPRANVERSLTAIERLDGTLRACIAVRAEARDEARRLAQRAAVGPLHGWAIAVKDNIDVAGTVRTDGLPPPHPAPAGADSEVVARLRAAGAVIVAKVNLEALAFGATTQNRTWGSCRNPWDLDRVPGGSSGGSAVAVASGMADASLGTDTGGSVRNPAALCGISALRPTAGWVPMEGITPLCPEFDVVGPMAHSAQELASLLAVMSGRADPEPDGDRLDGLRVGVPEPYFYDDLDSAVARGCSVLIELLETAGASVRRCRIAGPQEASDALALVLNAEAARLHPRWVDDERVDVEVRDRLRLGASTTETQLTRAHQVAADWRKAVSEAFEHHDVLLVPATPVPAPRIDTDAHMIDLSRRINRFCSPWSLARLPAMTIPCAADGLPVGGQFVGPSGSDFGLLGIGAAVQRISDWHRRRAPILAPAAS
jgi:aspartyl-tRNA(Asn)/glutamyl-tRNA(Gln) amidotransferase subunit A